MLKIKRIVRKFGNTEGAEIAEAALVLPLLFMLLLGIIWFGRAFNIYSTIQQAAQQGAIAAARATCATCGNVEATPAAVDTVVYTMMQADNLLPSQIQLPANPPNCGPGQPCSACPSPPGGGCTKAAGSNIYVCQNVQLNPTATPAQCGSVVSFQYPFSFNLLSFTPLGSVTLSAQAQSRMEN
ncbi:MAG TPA: TadE/TadG family type IV pilus assembly protein [Terriglobales bacterium]|nr:TadE/TadG family type IV pilus assembly protein [Terriglobales bacterium]